MTGLSILGIIVIAWLIYRRSRSKKPLNTIPANTAALLQQHVSFYAQLSAADQILFQNRVKDFLSTVRITGIGVEVEELDRILVAAGAIIPIFGFKDWKYNNISEVLLYNDTFSKDYRTEGTERNVLGMVGDGAMNRQMILSKPSLRSSFQQGTDGHNTVIHEFTHLIDKADGSVDGIPEYLLSKPYIIPWVKEIHSTIRQMKTGAIDDINLYGATNDAEFFAVVSEYFFEKPEELKDKHPELYDMLQRMFNTVES
jgi:MtfA peptidase